MKSSKLDRFIYVPFRKKIRALIKKISPCFESFSAYETKNLTRHNGAIHVSFSTPINSLYIQFWVTESSATPKKLHFFSTTGPCYTR